MAQSVPLALNENNDEEVLAVLITNQPSAATPLNLTGKTLEAFLKVSAVTPDVDGWVGTSVGGDVVVTDATAGEVSINIPAAEVTTTRLWWRLDVLASGKRKTALYGVVTVTDL